MKGHQPDEKMPTSSQALILTAQPAGPAESVFKTHSMHAKEPAPYAIASLIDLSEVAPSSTKAIGDSRLVKILGKESAQLFKYHNLPAGYTNILAYDTTRDCFKWQIIRCYDMVNNRNVAVAVNQDRELKQDGGKPRTAWAEKRPSPSSSFMCESRGNDSGPIRVESRSVYENLIELGFRKSDLVLKEDNDETRKEITFSEEDVNERGHEMRRARIRKNYAPEAKGNGVKIPEVEKKKGWATPEPDGKIVKTSELWAERYEMPLPSPASSRTDCSGCKSAKQRCYSAKKVVINDTDSFSDVISDEVDQQDADGFYRIKPSFFMVKNTPKSRPTTAVLSLRENEYSFHAEVKFYIETQTGTCVKSIQYDPLHIRSGKPDVRSRWIVDFNNVNDLEKVVKQGLIVGKDKIIIYKYDDIMKREFSAYRYFRAVNEAKKRLKAAKSTPDSPKAAASSTVKSKKKSLRNTKSAI